MNTYRAYILATCTYGLSRKILYLQNINIESKQNDDKKIPMLTTTKCMVYGSSTISSIWLWPFYLYNDLAKLETSYKGYDPKDYFYNSKYKNKSIIDYIFE